MKGFVSVVMSLVLIPIILLSFEYNEIVVENFDEINEDVYNDMKRRGFFPNCVPKSMHNVITAWDMDTNVFYMKFDIVGNDFYERDQCREIQKEALKFENELSSLEKMIYPNFVSKLNDKIKTDNMTYYKTEFAKRSFYIMIDNDKKSGYAFCE